MHVHGGRLVRATVFAMLRIELNNAFAVCLAGTADGRGQSPLAAFAVPCRLCDEKTCIQNDTWQFHSMKH